MPTYRVYFFDEDAHISKPPINLECADDEEAEQKARQYLDGKAIELWRDGALVAQFPKK